MENILNFGLATLIDLCKHTVKRKVSECLLIQPQGFKVFLWIYLTNEFHDAAGPLFSRRSQMASKCGENEKKKKIGTRDDSRVCHWCSYQLLKSATEQTSSVICYWKEARQLGIYLFYMIKETKKKKNAISCNLFSIQNEAISVVSMRSKVLWLVRENHTTVKLDWKDAFLVEYARKNSECEASWFEFWIKGALVKVEICVLCDSSAMQLVVAAMF